MQTRSQVAKIRESIREFGFINPVLLDENLGIIAGHGRVASSEMTQAEFTEFLTTFMRQAKEYYVDGALHYLFMDWKHVGEISTAGAAVYDDFKNICIWNETKNDVLTISDNNHLILKAFATAWKHREIYEECGDVDTVAKKVSLHRLQSTDILILLI